MHKYMMEIIIYREDDSQQTIIPLLDTTFVAVSAYQNVELKKLKVINGSYSSPPKIGPWVFSKPDSIPPSTDKSSDQTNGIEEIQQNDTASRLFSFIAYIRPQRMQIVQFDWSVIW